MCLSPSTEARGGGERWGLSPLPPFGACFSSQAAGNELLEGRETICDESFGFVQSLPRTEGKCILTYVCYFLGRGCGYDIQRALR